MSSPPGPEPSGPAPLDPGRLLAVDVYRGLAVAGMLLVDYQGDEAAAYPALRHAHWNGWTAADLVFPSFLFLVGVSVSLSVSARLGRGTTPGQVLRHAAGRAGLLFAIGVLANGVPSFDLASWRVLGVLQRIAICYFVTVALTLRTRWRGQLAVIAASLLGYWALLRWVPVPGAGFPGRDIGFLDPEHNLVAWLDRTVFPGRLYNGVRDPEGLLSTWPAIATSLLGLLTGNFLRPLAAQPDAALPARKAGTLLLAGLGGLAAGVVWHHWFPINKNLWTSSFVLLTAGAAMVILALLCAAIEVRRWRGSWTKPALVFGRNATLGFVLDTLVYLPFRHGQVHSAPGGEPITWGRYLQDWLRGHLGPANASLAYAVGIVGLCWALLLVCYRKRFFLKL